MVDLETIFDGFARGTPISIPNFKAVFDEILSGSLRDNQISTFLLGLENTGISPELLACGAEIMRAKMSTITAPENAIDIVGTGGDGLASYNISTACCFVVSGAGTPVAKHGNRAVSSQSGASDVLRELGVKLDITPDRNAACLAQSGVTFLFAPNHHPAMKHVASARAALGTRTIFNRLGPLCNPAGVEHYLLGVYDNDLRTLYANTLLDLGTKRALIVHGGDGMDEITTTDKTYISEIRGGHITEYSILPEEYGLDRATLPDLQGGDPKHNAKALRALLEGEVSAYLDIVLLNSGAALYVAGKADTIAQGVALARHSVQSGNAQAALDNLIRVSNAECA